jgi:signal transduction histidine kinase
MKYTHSLSGEISRIRRRLVCAYIFVVLSASISIGLFHQNTQRNLAKSYILGARNSILIGDYRQAISNLTPAIETGFSGVLLRSFNGRTIIEIPTDEIRKIRKLSFLDAAISEPIFSSENEKGLVAEAIFYYSVLGPLLSCLGFSLLSFLVFYWLLKFARRSLEEEHAYLLNQRQLETITIVANQVAHDIRSPLSAMTILASRSDFVSLEAQGLMKEALKRITDIADDLLTTRKKAGFLHDAGEARIAENDNEVVALKPMLESIIAEKNIEILGKLIIESDLYEAQGVQVRLKPAVFMRIISNLLNNSVEAMDKENNEISIHVRKYMNTVSITINDNGCGIPEALRLQLGQHGVTRHERVSMTGAGSGVGFWHAKRSIEDFGGKIEVFSKVEVGTQVVITLEATT